MIKRTNIEQNLFVYLNGAIFRRTTEHNVVGYYFMYGKVMYACLELRVRRCSILSYFPYLDFETTAIAIDCRRHLHSDCMKNDIIVFKPNIHSANIPKCSEDESFLDISVSGNRFAKMKHLYDLLLFISNLNAN